MSRLNGWLQRVPQILLALLVPIVVQAQASAIITGTVKGESGEPLEFANVYLNELNVSVPTNAQGFFSLNIPAARVLGQAVNLRVRAVGYTPSVTAIRLTPGNQTFNFTLKKDVNRLSEVVVTGSIEGTERSKVAFSVGRLTVEDIPVPALDPVRALAGKVAGMRVAQTSGQPGSTPEVMLRGPTSINASGRQPGPLYIIDGTIMRNQSLAEVGGLDIESVEVVKGAAGASLYGSTAANGVIIIKTKRGAPRDGVKFNFRSEYGTADVNSLNYGAPVNHQLQLDETGKRFCVQGAGAVSSCSRTFNWTQEILRINNFPGDTLRTQQNGQFAGIGSGGELLNVFQSNIWPEQRYNNFAQIVARNPTYLNSLDINGRAGGVRYFVSGSLQNEGGAIIKLNGQQQRRARVNLDYDVRSNWTVSISSLFNQGTTDQRGANFGALLRGAKAGTNYLMRDSLGRGLLRGGGTGFSPTGNGGGAFLYNNETNFNTQTSQRYLGSISSAYTPADWVTIEALYSYDNRNRINTDYQPKGTRSTGLDLSTNLGNIGIGNLKRESMNAQLSATFRKQVTTDLSAKATLRYLADRDYQVASGGSGERFIVKDVYTLSNIQDQTTKGVSSFSQTIKNQGAIAGANFDYKGKYILDGTFRYDGSSLFGEGNRWAPFSRISGVWRVSEESFFNVPGLSDFRLRASRGSAGNTPRFSAQYETYNCGAAGCSLGQAGNRNLKPETTTEVELGSDFTLFDRLGIEFTYAQSDTKNQILEVPTPASLGFTTQWQNAGTLQNKTFEVAANLPLITKKDLQWNMRGTFDRTRTYITELLIPAYFTSGGTGQGTGSLFQITADRTVRDGYPLNRYGNIYGRKFYKTCGDLPGSVQAQCGPNKAFQVDDKGWVVWAGEGNSYRDGITKNLWQTKLPAANSPWNYPLQFGHPIIARPLKGEKGEGTGIPDNILGNALPNFRFGLNSTLSYKRLSLYGLLDATIGNYIQNQGEGWGLLDIASGYFDQGNATVETAKPLGYSWRAGGGEGAGSGGFYDLLGPNNYNVEKGSFAKIREVSLTYNIGRIAGQGDWAVSAIGRNLFTFTNYSGYDPELGVSGGGQSNNGLVNQVDAFNFPTLRTFTLSLSSRF